MKNQILVLVVLLSTVFAACTGKNAEEDNRVPERTTVPEAETAAVPGQQLFERKCAACHGSDGTAGIGSAANLQASRIDTLEVARIVKEGKGSMPAFAAQISKEEAMQVTQYVMALRR